jgi:class 3 adenylate cyclase/esterase/lipase
MASVGSERAALLGASEGGSLCTLFAATHPERASALILCGAIATTRWSPETPWAPTREMFEGWIRMVEEEWGAPLALELFAPSVAQDKRFREWWARLLRLAASPATAVQLLRILDDVDVRPVLPTIRVPTLVLHASGDRIVNVENGRYFARHIPNAKYVELAGIDHFPYLDAADAVLAEIEEFVTGARQAPESDRVLATVLFIDIVGSTSRAAEMGDQRWRDLLEHFQALVRRDLARFRGREVKTLGDGFLAIFDGPARAIRCARAIRDGVRALGIEIRAGLHTGECELMGEDVGGIAVHIGARVAASASPGEVLVSSTVKDLVTGSGLGFVDRGTQELRGVPGSGGCSRWETEVGASRAPVPLLVDGVFHLVDRLVDLLASLLGGTLLLATGGGEREGSCRQHGGQGENTSGGHPLQHRGSPSIDRLASVRGSLGRQQRGDDGGLPLEP